MQLPAVVVALLASVVSARDFTLYTDANYGGTGNRETRDGDSACWNLNGKGDQASSVRGDSWCTTFYRERDCQGSSWVNVGSAPTVPSFLNDHIWSFRNQCACPDGLNPCQYTEDDGTCSFGYAACLKNSDGSAIFGCAECQ